MDCVTDCGTRRSQTHSHVRPLTVNLESSVSTLSLWAVDVSGPALSENGDALGCSEPQILVVFTLFTGLIVRGTQYAYSIMYAMQPWLQKRDNTPEGEG